MEIIPKLDPKKLREIKSHEILARVKQELTIGKFPQKVGPLFLLFLGQP